MSEVYAKPTNEQIKKAQELYGDPLFYWGTNTAVKCFLELNKESYADYSKRSLYRLSRLTILHFGYPETLGVFITASEDLDNNTWKDFELPKQEIEIRANIDPTARRFLGKLE